MKELEGSEAENVVLISLLDKAANKRNGAIRFLLEQGLIRV